MQWSRYSCGLYALRPRMAATTSVLDTVSQRLPYHACHTYMTSYEITLLLHVYDNGYQSRWEQ